MGTAQVLDSAECDAIAAAVQVSNAYLHHERSDAHVLQESSLQL